MARDTLNITHYKLHNIKFTKRDGRVSINIHLWPFLSFGIITILLRCNWCWKLLGKHRPKCMFIAIEKNKLSWVRMHFSRKATKSRQLHSLDRVMILEFHCSHFSFCLSLTLHIPSFFSFSNCQTLFIHIFFYILPQFMSLFLSRSFTTSQCLSVSFSLPYFLYPLFFLLSPLPLYLRLCLSFCYLSLSTFLSIFLLGKEFKR